MHNPSFRSSLSFLTLAFALGAMGCSGSHNATPEPAVEPEPAPVPAPTEPADPAVIQSSAGAIRVHPVQHATFRLDVEGGPVVWVDPVIAEGAPPLEGAADLILVTDIHGDHLSAEGIAAVLGASTAIVAPAAVADQLATDAPELTGVIRLANGESTEAAGVKIQAVPMYNLERGPEPGQKFHDKGRGNGYLLDIGDARIYISGDTECIDEMKALTEVDAAFVCMNLPYTMTPEEAAGCVTAFHPAVVYPYHYRGAEMSDVDVFATPVSAAGVEVRRLAWYPEPAAGEAGEAGVEGEAAAEDPEKGGEAQP